MVGAKKKKIGVGVIERSKLLIRDNGIHATLKPDIAVLIKLNNMG